MTADRWRNTAHQGPDGPAPRERAGVRSRSATATAPAPILRVASRTVASSACAAIRPAIPLPLLWTADDEEPQAAARSRAQALNPRSRSRIGVSATRLALSPLFGRLDDAL